MVETCNIAPAAKFAAESPRLPDRRQAEPARRTAIHSSVSASGLTANGPLPVNHQRPRPSVSPGLFCPIMELFSSSVLSKFALAWSASGQL